MSDRDGPLFRGRYKAILVESDQYFLQVSRYIHLNPVSSGICKNPMDYKWSSMRFFADDNKSIPWMITSFTLNQMSGVNKRLAYLSYVNEGVDEETSEFYGKKHLASIYGLRKFIESRLNDLEKSYVEDVLTDINRTRPYSDPENILNQVIEYFQTTLPSLYDGKKGKKNVPRLIAIYLLRELGHLKHREIAKIFPGIKAASISTHMMRSRKLMDEEADFRNHIGNISIRINKYCQAKVSSVGT